MSKIKINICPKCKSVGTLTYFAGALTGTYKCKRCNYNGPIILERYVDLKDKK